MATALDVINSAARMLRILGQSETLSAEDAANSLVVLNDLLESWSLDGAMVYRVKDEAFNTVAGIDSYTIGSGGTWNTTRPLAIESAYYRDSNEDYPIRVDSKEDWDTIGNKTIQSPAPEELYYDPDYPLGRVYIYPTPSKVVSVHLNSYQQFTAMTALTDVFSLPPAYKHALRHVLAIELAPELNATPPDVVVQLAITAKADLKRLNKRHRVPRACYDVPRDRFVVVDILRGE